MVEIEPSQYFDVYEARAVNVVLLTIDDELGREARAVVRRISQQLHHRHVTFWSCRLRGPDDTEVVECCRVPQFRFIVDGQERRQHVGVLEDEDLVALLGEL